MTYRIIYNNQTGQILLNKSLSENALQELLNKHANWAYINGAVDSLTERVVNLQTLKIEKRYRKTASVANLIRERRKLLLQGCDWTQAADSPLSAEQKQAWADYRQALRNLPDQQGQVNSIDEVVWPATP